MRIFRGGVALIGAVALLALSGCGNKSNLVKPGDAKPPVQTATPAKVPRVP